jgi:hypothetical protein
MRLNSIVSMPKSSKSSAIKFRGVIMILILISSAASYMLEQSAFGAINTAFAFCQPKCESKADYTAAMMAVKTSQQPTTSSPSRQHIQLTSGGAIYVGFSTNPSNPNTRDQTQLGISFINKQTNAIQLHIDYKVSVMKGNKQVFGIPITHTAERTVSIPFQFQNAGIYQVTVEVYGILMQPIPPETATFDVSVGEYHVYQQPQNKEQHRR